MYRNLRYFSGNYENSPLFIINMTQLIVVTQTFVIISRREINEARAAR